jgi:hypothetical protein
VSTAPWEYKVVPMPRDVAIKRRVYHGLDSQGAAAGYVEQIINQHARQGWQFVGISETSVRECPGCLAPLFGRRAFLTVYELLTFRPVGNEAC